MPVRKIISHQTPDGTDVQSEWYFSLGKTDMAEMELAHMKDPGTYLKEIVENEDSRRMLDLWQEMLFRSVGIREDDLIIKDAGVIRRFKGCGAYEAFFADLVEMPDAGFSFFISIMPADIQKKIAESETQERQYNDDELLAMSDEDFMKVAGKNPMQWSKHHTMIAMKRKTGNAA
jgi:hypothetical protein